jgi:methyl-accepting chemotaxis protein
MGVVGGDLSLNTLVEIINAVDFGGIGHAFLVDAMARSSSARTKTR